MKKKPKVSAILVYQSLDNNIGNDKLISAAIAKLIETFGKLSIFSNCEYPQHEISYLGKKLSLKESLRLVKEKSCHDDSDSIAICYDWYPILDPLLSQELLLDHQKYLAHFTYGENIPIGFAPDFATKDFIEELPEQVPNDLRAFVLKNIEKYDVEIFYKNPDLRQYRLNFSTANPRSQKLVQKVIQNKNTLSYNNLEKFIQDNPEILRPYPSYFEIELSTKSPVSPLHWPKRETENTNLDFNLILKLSEDLKENGMKQDASIALGGLGEPTEHPRFLEILEIFLKLEQIQCVYLESCGLNLNEGLMKSIAELEQIEKLHIIIGLNSLKRDRYKEMYLTDVFDEINKNIRYIEGLNSRPYQVYAEMVRMQENDDEIEAYFARFEKSPINVLVQKYNRYIDLLVERRAANLNPLHRDFCWHLARDFYLNAFGNVLFCKQDPFANRAKSLPFVKLKVNEILEKTMSQHIASVQGKHSKISMPCLKCDEWYTFNG